MKFICNRLPSDNSYGISISRFALLLSLLNTVLFNGALYSYLSSYLDVYSASGFFISASVVVIVFVFNLFFISLMLLVSVSIVKILFVITALINSIALYYMTAYQVVLDITMMGNVFNTRSSELFELVTPSLFIYIFVLGIIPSLFLVKVKINKNNKLKMIVNLFVLFSLGFSFLYINGSSWLWLDKHSKLLGGKILPWSYIVNTVRHYSSASKAKENEILLPEGTFINDDQVAVVLVIGEAARKANFSVYGYPRKTNPLLEEEDILVFDLTTSCATYTTVSIACMLSYDIDTNKYEALPSYLTRLGANVIWHTNNWGEPSIDVTEYQEASDLRKKCHGDECYLDHILLTGLQQKIELSNKQKTFVVLHTKGSHGPSYYSRYPLSFEKFIPVCRYEEVSKCTQQELINAYDNTILYTDYFLSEIIKKLKRIKNIPVMLVYISDHGESLGEKGLYLHGIPYAFAPKFQKEIPFIIWRSKKLIALQGVKNSEINQQGNFSQENIFHTIINVFGLQTEVYESHLDVLQKKTPINK